MQSFGVHLTGNMARVRCNDQIFNTEGGGGYRQLNDHTKQANAMCGKFQTFLIWKNLVPLTVGLR